MSEAGRKSLRWNEETVYALGIYRLVGRGLGIWPLKCNDFGSKIRLVVIAVLQISVIRIHERKMRCIVDSAMNDWSVVRDDESRDTMRRHAYGGRLVATFQLSVACLATGVLIIGAPPTLGITTDQSSEIKNSSVRALRNLPKGTACSVANAPMHLYLALYFLQVFQLVCVIACNFGIDSLFFGMAMHLCAQFELLKKDVAALDRHSCEKKCKKQFATLIDRHNHLVCLVNFLEDVFHLIILGQLAASGLHITVMGIQILVALRDNYYATALYMPGGITILLLQLGMYSFVGDYLSSQAMGVRNAAYNCSWYNFSPSFAKDIMFVAMRSNDSVNLTAGKVFRMNIEGFTRIVKTMASLFSVIKITIIG